MGYSLTPLGFVDVNFGIRPHTATDVKHIGKRVTLDKFARGGMASVSQRDDNQEYVFEGPNGAFAEGPFAPPKA